MHVFQAISSCTPDYGGPAFLVARLAQTLASRGVQVSVWAADGSAPTTSLLPPSSPVRRLAGNLKDALTSGPVIDVVHDHGIWLPYNHRLAKLSSSRKIPRIVSLHGMLDPWCLKHKAWRKRLAWRLYQKNDLRAAEVHHVTSNEESQNLKKLKLGIPVKMVALGVDMPANRCSTLIEETRSTTKVAVFLGRLNPVKGLPLLIEAWKRVRPEGWELRIAGPDNGGHRIELERLVDAHGLAGVITFVGPLYGSEKQDFLLQADLFILPSLSESFGLAIAEALSHQLPVLTTTAAPWRILEKEACGWLVEPTLDAMTDGLLRSTSQNTQTLEAMGAKGRNWVEAHLRWEHVAEQFLGAYERVLC
jgi:glycosyltransferase involved in cell wall biosynthesis